MIYIEQQLIGREKNCNMSNARLTLSLEKKSQKLK